MFSQVCVCSQGVDMSGTISFPGVGISVSKSLPAGRVSGGEYPGVGTQPPGWVCPSGGYSPPIHEMLWDTVSRQ